MLIGFYPTLTDEKGRLKGVSMFQFLASDSLEELKPHAVKAAQEEKERQFIAQLGDRYVLFDKDWRTSEYFQGKSIIVQFAAESGKESVPRNK